MMNLISSDIYRLRKGAALRNTWLAMLGMLAFLVGVMVLFNSGLLEELMRRSIQGQPEDVVAQVETRLEAQRASTMSIPTGGAAFGEQMVDEFTIPPFLFLPIVLAVFGADFAANTYRNTLAYEGNRTRVYLAKLLLSVIICLSLVLGMVLAGWLLGGLGFGFGGFSTGGLARMFTTLLLQLPIYLSLVAMLHCIMAFSQKNSTTIAFYLVGLLVVGILASLLFDLTGQGWAMLLDPLVAGKQLADRASLLPWQVMFVPLYYAIITVVATLAGLFRFRRADLP